MSARLPTASLALMCAFLALFLTAGAPPTAAPLARVIAGEPGSADLDPTNDYIVAPPDLIPDCEARLRDASIVFAPARLPVRPGKRGSPTCGTEQAVVYRHGPEGIRYTNSPIVSCGMALALARFETVLNEEARRELGQPVVRIEHLGTYACRTMARYPTWVSEHSYANAIDIETLTLKSGRKLSILKHFGKPEEPPQTTEARFLRTLSHRLYDEDVFSAVITPMFDALHKNHFHVDLARYRVDGTRG